MTKPLRQVIVVGAGFSYHAGLPLQSDFTQALLEARKYKKKAPSRALVTDLSEFIHHAFDHEQRAKAEYWPQLEDIFTSIDLLANSGHHLGGNYAPSELRAVRRKLLSRTILIVASEVRECQDERRKKA